LEYQGFGGIKLGASLAMKVPLLLSLCRKRQINLDQRQQHLNLDSLF